MSTLVLKTWRDPYDAGFSPTTPRTVEFHPGLTVLVGCNGAGKSTLLLNLAEFCRKSEIPYLEYDNLKDGGGNALGELFYQGNYDEGAYLFSSSEGESIKANLGCKARLFAEFIKSGIVDDTSYRIFKAFSDKEKSFDSNDRVFIFDAVDSGLSVDSIIEVKTMFDLVLEDNKDSGKNLYIVIAANEYELARNSDCFDVNAGKYLHFADYEDYRTFIINSRKKKEARIEKQIKWREKQKEKERKQFYQVKAKQEETLEKLHLKKEQGKYVSSWEEHDAEQMLEDFFRHSRFLSKKDVGL